MRRIVLLGTGTGVGKTYVGSAILERWRTFAPCLALKPIESGVCLDHPGQPTDALALAGVTRPAGENPLPRDHGLHLPQPPHFLALPDPVSPHLAARRSGVTVDLPGAAAWVAQQEKHYTALHDYTPDFLALVETAGGAFSPLSDEETCADFATRLAPAWWILVAPDSLGVLHDVRATLLALQAAHRAPDLVVLSAAREPDAASGTNARELEQQVFPRLGAAAPRLREVPVFRPGQDAAARVVALLRNPESSRSP